ncbi:hypothetical protein HHE014_00330 [Helicobacter heilmannii]|nr:hypothetical protein HHE014_00330 [Helicobacter heilmannii]
MGGGQQKVYISTKCQITPTSRPNKDLGALEYLQELRAYIFNLLNHHRCLKPF